MTVATRVLLGLCVALGFTLSPAYGLKVAELSVTAPNAPAHAHLAHTTHTTPSPDEDGSSHLATPHCLACALAHGTTLQPLLAVEATALVTSVVPYHTTFLERRPVHRKRARAPPPLRS
jgi:hypothetical protein